MLSREKQTQELISVSWSPDPAWSIDMQRSHSLGNKKVIAWWDIPALLGTGIRDHGWGFISALFHCKWEMELHIYFKAD